MNDKDQSLPKTSLSRKGQNEILFDSCKINLSSEKFVSDAVGDDYFEKWVPSTPVFISAQTGTGKNTFVEQVLIEKMVPKRYKILILSNRIALGRQAKARIAKIMDRIEPRRERGRSYIRDVERRNGEMLDELEDFGSVTIMSYQGFLARSKSIRNKGYNYVVLDECHFFLADAKFNKRTHTILKRIIEDHANAIRVYMTATPYEALIPLINYENENRILEDQRRDSPPKFWGNQITEKLSEEEHMFMDIFGNIHKTYFGYSAAIYEMTRNFGYIHCQYLKVNSEKENKEETDMRYSSWKALAVIIKEQIEKEKTEKLAEKWMVFVPSKRIGEELRRTIGDEYATLVTASAKKKTETKDKAIKDAEDAYIEIYEKDRFSKKVLICTSVLDNGINIADDAVKNIAVLVFDKVSFLQMLGRKRIKEGEQINLYIQEHNRSAVNYKLNGPEGIDKSLWRIAKYSDHKQEIVDDIFARDRIFYCADEECEWLSYNQFLEEKLKCEKEFCEKMLNSEETMKRYEMSYEQYIQKAKGEKQLEIKNDDFEKRSILEQLSWMGLAHTFDLENYVVVEDEAQQERKREAAERELFDLLEQHSVDKGILDGQENIDDFYLDKGMDQEAQERFKEAFKRLAINVFGKRKNDKKNDRPYGLVVINGILKDKDLPYSILSHSIKREGTSQTFWLLVKK